DFERVVLTGSRDGDTLRGLEQGPFFTGDSIAGDLGDDTIFGGGGNDTLVGGLGRDELFGGDGNDLLIAGVGSAEGGTDPGNLILTGEVMVGGAGADRFILGDETGTFYGQVTGQAADTNFAFLQDFDRSEDRLQLAGTADDYVVVLNDIDVGMFVALASTGERVFRTQGFALATSGTNPTRLADNVIDFVPLSPVPNVASTALALPLGPAPQEMPPLEAEYRLLRLSWPTVSDEEFAETVAEFVGRGAPRALEFADQLLETRAWLLERAEGREVPDVPPIVLRRAGLTNDDAAFNASLEDYASRPGALAEERLEQLIAVRDFLSGEVAGTAAVPAAPLSPPAPLVSFDIPDLAPANASGPIDPSAIQIGSADGTRDFSVQTADARAFDEGLDAIFGTNVTNIALSGAAASFGTFRDAFGADNGLVLSTGRVSDLAGRNIDAGAVTSQSAGGALPLIFEEVADGVVRARIPDLPQGLRTLTLVDDNDFIGGSAGRFSGLDLGAIVLSRDDGSSISTVTDLNGLLRLNVFDFTPAGLDFEPGTQRPTSNAGLISPDLAGSVNGLVDNSIATLGVAETSLTTGYHSFGDGGRQTKELTQPDDTETPLKLYLAELSGTES
ncbi:MAG: hypothetical protein AAF568_09450, partial [Pseudomonadota bacterium]